MSSTGGVRGLGEERARAIALYLPQFHAIPENDTWWGRGFTEWTNVRRARPLYAGHRQPRRPTEIGYYDLSSPDVRAAQAELASAHGIEAFCYWHYWFAGRRLLERPFDAVVRSGEPKMPFCLAWANHDWTAAWVGRPYRMLVAQTYPGVADYDAHFDALRPAFEDERYVRVKGKPLFVVFRPRSLPDPQRFADHFRGRAHAAGLPGLHLLGILDPTHDPVAMGFDGSIDPGIGQLLEYAPTQASGGLRWSRRVQARLTRHAWATVHQAIARMPPPPTSGWLGKAHDVLGERLLLPFRIDHGVLVNEATRQVLRPTQVPCVLPNWDNTPRMGRWGVVLEGSTPEVFARHLEWAIQSVEQRPPEERLVFIKSWNEWAEGNYLEPDTLHGRGYLEAIAERLRAPAMRAEGVPT